jgi:hypothetical protein
MYVRDIESETLLKPAQLFLRELGIKYVHLQKTRHGAYDTNHDMKGLPDMLVFPKTGKMFAVEFKVPNAKLSKSQEEWKLYFINNGYFYEVIYDIKRFYRLVAEMTSE